MATTTQSITLHPAAGWVQVLDGTGTVDAIVSANAGGVSLYIGDAAPAVDAVGHNITGVQRFDKATKAWAKSTGATNRIVTTGPFVPLVIQSRLPENIDAPVNTDVVMHVIATGGTAPYTYEWKYNDVVLAGQTTDTLTNSDVTGDSAGVYSVKVTDSTATTAQTATSSTTLTVSAVPAVLGLDPHTDDGVLTGGPVTYDYELSLAAGVATVTILGSPAGASVLPVNAVSGTPANVTVAVDGLNVNFTPVTKDVASVVTITAGGQTITFNVTTVA
jgi:hypothetical protein